MAISHSQLMTWSAQGSITGSCDTFNSVKSSLEASNTQYRKENVSIYLQGSYKNDTNVYAESDIDIIMQLNSAFHYDLRLLSDEQKLSFQHSYAGSVNYGLNEFRHDVFKHIQEKYGASVSLGSKTINISPNGSRRKSDIIVCLPFRQYLNLHLYHEGICFLDTNNRFIVNFPKQHSNNCTKKHQNTSSWYKPTVRIFKNIRNHLVKKGIINPNEAPSYFIEGMLYNIPDIYFNRNFTNILVNSLNWLIEADKNKLICANEQHYLINETTPTAWHPVKYDKFVDAVCELWQQW